jgi:hypothetical protein
MLQTRRVYLADPAMKNGSLRIQIETFHVQHTSIGGLHQHRDACFLCVLAETHLHREVVTFFDEQIQPRREELLQIIRADAVQEDLNIEVRVNLEHGSRSQDGLAYSDLQYASAQPVQVGQVQAIEVGDTKRASDAL